MCETSVLVGENVAYYRTRRGLSQQALADKCGVSRPRITEIEGGRGNPTTETLEIIARELGIGVSKLFHKRNGIAVA